jgi:hypothetical protein
MRYTYVKIKKPILRQDVAASLGADFIHAACLAAGHTCSGAALLTPVAIIHWFLVQVLQGTTSLTHVSLLAGRAFSDAAFCMARAKLPLAVFQAVLRQMVRVVIPDTEAIGRWRGHRTFLVDGSSFSMPDNPDLQARFGQPGNHAKGCGFQVVHLLALFHAGTGLLLEDAAAPLRTSDFAGLAEVLGPLSAGDILVADRGFGSFAGLALVLDRGIHPVFRVHQKQIVDFAPGRAHARPGQRREPKGMPRSRLIWAHGLRDQVVEYSKPAERPDRMSAGNIGTRRPRSWCGSCGIGSRFRGSKRRR